ncbi:phenylacetic acid degradation protein [Mycolicibacterium chitae]|uniref:Thioesterase superfamily protein n=1 Tax=Mycolicibacterium chitae TaxID=1792 RepID=A0A448IDI2_MYCCI|nr:hotdog domain-containing protein [Mycolicibacterium chitae]BBZ01588.1 phenylacetic acid degradation protein [Mycolicibacterium chitae]VEG50424.1 thioesterase superfamily protein [Mycolicibacterium chitae]
MTATLHEPNTPLGRFGIETLSDAGHRYVATLPAARWTNPHTGRPSLAPLAVLVDYVGGMVNHHRRAPDEWTVSSELALELVPGAADLVAAAPGSKIVASARPVGPKGRTCLGTCELTLEQQTIAVGSVRSVHISIPATVATQSHSYPPADPLRSGELAELMCVRVGDAGPDDALLWQAPSPVLDNSMGVVHGGVAAAGCELVAAAALDGAGTEPETALLTVSYLRPFRSAATSHYRARVSGAGGRRGVAEVEAIGGDGRTALQARVTAYR